MPSRAVSDRPLAQRAGNGEHSRTLWLQLALVAAVAAICFVQTARYDFAYDDKPQVLENPRIRSFSNLGEVFFENVWAFQGLLTNYFRPLHSVTYMAAYAIGGLSPFTFHLVNIILHVLVSLAVLWIGWELFPGSWAALGGALLFAAHPMHTESVAWVAGVTDVGAGLFSRISSA